MGRQVDGRSCPLGASQAPALQSLGQAVLGVPQVGIGAQQAGLGAGDGGLAGHRIETVRHRAVDRDHAAVESAMAQHLLPGPTSLRAGAAQHHRVALGGIALGNGLQDSRQAGFVAAGDGHQERPALARQGADRGSGRVQLRARARQPHRHRPARGAPSRVGRGHLPFGQIRRGRRARTKGRQTSQKQRSQGPRQSRPERDPGDPSRPVASLPAKPFLSHLKRH